MTAAEMIIAHMASCLPLGAPLSFTIDRARFEGTGRGRSAIADVTMFDRVPGRVEVFQWGHGQFGHRWISVGGADCFLGPLGWAREEPTQIDWVQVHEDVGGADAG